MEISLGKLVVPVPGTPVQFTFNQTNPAASLLVHAFMVESLPSNTGKVYVGLAGFSKATLTGALAVLAIPTVNTIPTFSETIAFASDAIQLNNKYIDADVAGEGCLVSAIVA